MKRTKRFAEGGFSKEQESWLGGADRTDPYILARMRKAVPDSVAKEPETAMDDGTTEGISAAAAAAKTEAPASTAFMDEKEPGWDTKSAPAKSAPAKSAPAKSAPAKASAASKVTDTGDETARLAARYLKPMNKNGHSAATQKAIDDYAARDADYAAREKELGAGARPARLGPRVSSGDEGRGQLNIGAFKQGGAVKKMASGGSASRRADGIAQRGKTRGKMC
jgi:hypothetical protein